LPRWGIYASPIPALLIIACEMTYAIVHDIPASWGHYEALRAALTNPAPRGLLLHVAGPTDEGLRLIDIWASSEDWQRFRPAREALLTPFASPRLRELNCLATINGSLT
jgi:hypothetical protein